MASRSPACTPFLDSDLCGSLFSYLRSYAHAVFGLLLGELPVVVHVVLVYARQL